MFIYIITALCVLVVVCLSAIVAQYARKFDYAGYVVGGDKATNIKQLAIALKDVEKVGSVPNVAAILGKIRKAYAVVRQKAERKETLLECEKWLLENYRSVTAGIKRSDYTAFAALPHKGEARILHVATTIAAQNYCRLDADTVAGAVHEFCRYTPLSYDELNALGKAFEIALLRKIAFVADKIRLLGRMKRRAEEDREPDAKLGKKEGYLYYYRASGKKIPEKYLGKAASVNAENIEFAFAGAASDYARLIANAVTSLKGLRDFFTPAFRISLSTINSYYERDKSYRDSDPASKEQYLAATAKLAAYFSSGEYAVAKGAFDLAARFDKHFGEIIFDHRYALASHVRGKYVAALKRTSYKADKWAYYVSVFLLQTVFSFVSCVFLPILWLRIAVFFLTFVACYPPCAYIAERSLSFVLPKRPVPRMNYDKLPLEGATAVVVPIFVTSEKQARNAVENVLAMQAVNSDENLTYYLLCDLKESDCEKDVSDDGILSAMAEFSGRKNFVVLVRKRVKTGERYGAYERKRGAVRDFNEYMLTGDDSKFSFVSRKSDAKPKFAMVLDEDSRLSAGEVLTAVNTALHPLNAKYDVLAFSSVYSLKSLKTPYSKKYVDYSGMQSYCHYDDFFYDLCARSVFCGKGIYRIEEFHKKTSAAVPDGKVLSHDVLEGALADTGSLDLAVSEDAPDSFVSDVTRSRRWTRGDLLLLPFAGKKYRSDGIYAYIVLKNVFAIFAPVCALVLWIFTLIFGYPLMGLAVFFASFSMPAASLAVSAVSARNVKASRSFSKIFSTVSRAVADVLLLPFYAVDNLLTAAGTFADYVFNSRALLRWRPFSSTLGQKDFYRHAAAVAPSCIFAAFVAAAFYFSIPLATYFLAYIVAVNLLYFAGKQYKKRLLREEERRILTEYAKATYGYFAAFDYESLPCDNVQYYPPNGSSATTSPTNIGYSLLAEICASKLGFETPLRARERVVSLLDKVDSLDKWKGHLYNWYDVNTSKPVAPLFVSSADSGNLVAALTVTRSFLAENGDKFNAYRCKKLIDETDFSALTDRDKNQLYIGYDVGSGKYCGHYDMMASEARLTVYGVCCRSGDQSLWRGLSRRIVNSHGNVLASWSGTAFEYLMPQLFLPDFEGSLITSSVRRAVKTYISRKCNSLWGVSESGYYAFDANANYQYKAHGLSELALRNEDDRCVIAPYASAMAVKYAPKKVTDNLGKLSQCGGACEFGFYEAIDFSSGKNTVASCMTHHQGMILCALTNALVDDAIVGYFMRDDAMRGGELLLAEPEDHTKAARERKRDFVYDDRKKSYGEEIPLGEFPEVCLLHGKEYSVVIDDYGCGYSRWRDRDVNVFSHDFYKNSGGFGYFVSDGEIFSPTFAPLKKDGGSYKARFSDDSAEFQNVGSNCRLKVYAPAVISGEVREYTVENKSDSMKKYVFVFAERAALSRRNEYAAHPAFCDLFVKAEFDAEKNTVYLKRKPRESTGGFTLAATMLCSNKVFAECNRLNLYGRNRDESNPALDFGGDAPSTGDVLFPAVGLKCEFTLAPGQSETVAVVIQCSDDEDALRYRVERVLGTDFLDYACKSASGAESVMSKYLPDLKTARYAGKLAAKLLYEPYPLSALKAREAGASQLVFKEKTLVLRYDGNAAFTKKAVLSALACRLAGIDLRLFIEYDGNKTDALDEIAERCGVKDIASLPFVTVFDVNAYKPRDVKNFESTAFFVMKELEGNMSKGTTIAVRRRNDAASFVQCELPEIYPSGNGGFADGDYVVTSVPSAPYSNVASGRNGGFVATENGGGYAYFLNSRENKLSGWSNDPVADPPFDRVLVSDGDGVIRINRLNEGGYVRHGEGRSVYKCRTWRADYDLKKSVLADGRIIATTVRIENHDDNELSLSVIYLVDPCADVCENRADVYCEKHGKDSVRIVNVKTGRSYYLYAENAYELITDKIQAVSRGVNGYNPKRGESAFNNPLAGAEVRIRLKKHESATVEFALCDEKDTLETAKKRDLFAYAAENAMTVFPLRLESGDKDLDLLFAKLPYQVLSSRMNARCGFYQAGGAIGFRDQLQDCLALLWSDPARVREHILLCAERQYIEGDVMHWWHSPAFGVRTRISDDKLFLPYVVCEYVAHTGDESILSETCAYLSGEPLGEMQEARLEHGRYFGASEKLLLHMQRAIDSALVTGEHGLLLIGGGDWNDALNEIGMRGRGESVWLTMFAVEVIDKFCELIDDESAKRYKKAAAKLRNALENAFFDGRWARAFTDGGEWLGVKRSKGCKTDLICQSWAQIVKAGDEKMRKSALDAAKTLVDEKTGTVKLFDPPFDGKKRYGYISAYPEGVRENGGQYTHAAVWYLIACCRAGDKAEANRVLRLLNPVKRCRDAEKNAAYKGEPYVLAGDVYTNPDNAGRAGWTWYTGSAAWMYKAVIEEMLGVKKLGDSLRFSTPMIDAPERVRLEYDRDGTTYVLRFERSEKKGLRINGVNYTNSTILHLEKNAGRKEVTVLFEDRDDKSPK